MTKGLPYILNWAEVGSVGYTSTWNCVNIKIPYGFLGGESSSGIDILDRDCIKYGNLDMKNR